MAELLASALQPFELPPEAAASLTPFERRAVRLAAAIDGSRLARRLAQGWSVHVIDRVVRLFCNKRIRVVGEQHLYDLAPSAGVMLATNHRSFFDLFVAASCFQSFTHLARRVHFPVRSSFWYDHPLGPLVNALGTGMSMFPPVFRPASKRGVTRLGLDRLAQELGLAGTLVGMHPEGTRSRSADPYELLPPEQSFGRVALLARPVIVPAFVSGLGNSLLGEFRAALAGAARPIYVVFGAPIELGDYGTADPHLLRNQIEVGRRVLQVIAELGDRERAERSRASAAQVT